MTPQEKQIDKKYTLSNNYNIINITLLGFCLFILFFPLLSVVLERIFPALWICPYKNITGSACPFCSITTDFWYVYTNLNFNGIKNKLSIIVIIFITFELFLRLFIQFLKNYVIKYIIRIIISDILLHTVSFVIFLIYFINI